MATLASTATSGTTMMPVPSSAQTSVKESVWLWYGISNGGQLISGIPGSTFPKEFPNKFNQMGVDRDDDLSTNRIIWMAAND